MSNIFPESSNVWEYIYDANKRLIKAVDPTGYVASYEYNTNGQATETVSALNAQIQPFYDEIGRIIKPVDAEGNEAVYGYNILGRLVEVAFADDTYIKNNCNANGWLVSALDQIGDSVAVVLDFNLHDNKSRQAVMV